MISLFVGRFQPFHLGHLKVVEELARKSEKLVIIIGSSKKHGIPDNPFSAQEREEMIRRALEGQGIRNYEISAVPDVFDDREWVASIREKGDFDVVFTRNPWTTMCFRNNDVEVREHEMYREGVYKGTEIRRRMLKEEAWEQLVPAEVSEYLREIGGAERVKNLPRGDWEVGEINDMIDRVLSRLDREAVLGLFSKFGEQVSSADWDSVIQKLHALMVKIPREQFIREVEKLEKR